MVIIIRLLNLQEGEGEGGSTEGLNREQENLRRFCEDGERCVWI